MIIKSNMDAIRSRNQLQANDKQLAKDLKKISSGQKINSAEDGASEYSIGKKMDVMIRSLDQDIDNSKTGRNLVATAEGGIQEIVNNLRDMKAMAINSANDHNTDADRATLEKEFSSRMGTITDIAATTNYNGRLLLNGDFGMDFDRVESVPVPHYTQKTITVGPPSVTVKPATSGYSPAGGTTTRFVIVQDNAVTDLTKGFSAATNTVSGSVRFVRLNETVQNGFLPSSGTSTGIRVKMDFTAANLNGGTVPSALNQQGFCIGCSGCDQYINIVFDDSTTATTLEGSFYQDMTYTIGVKNVTSLSDLPKAIYDGISSQNGTKTFDTAGCETGSGSVTGVRVDTNHSLHLETDGTDYYLVKGEQSLYIALMDSGKVAGEASEDDLKKMLKGFDGKPGTYAIQNPVTQTVTDVTYTYKQEEVHHEGKPLIIHTGPKANQHLRVFINSMHPIALGINRATIVTRDKAVESLGIIDAALEYSLNEATRMGAYQSRLTQTEGNLVTSDENTVASKSAIMDTDMAKAMVQYTKSSVLTQSAQLMLAQANQNSSSVLSLLQ